MNRAHLKTLAETTVMPDGGSRPHTSEMDLGEIAGRSSVFKLVGQFWYIKFNGRIAFLPNRKGMRYIHKLLADSEQPVSAVELEAWVAGDLVSHANDADRTAVEEAVLSAELTDRITERHEEMLPQDARTRLAKELRLLEEEMASSEDMDKRTSLEDNIAKLKNYLAGCEGRKQTFADRGTRSRTSVRNAISRAIVAIQQHNKPLGIYLSNSIHTGFKCQYRPHGEVEWFL
jgi:hypothetical protein